MLCAKFSNKSKLTPCLQTEKERDLTDPNSQVIRGSRSDRCNMKSIAILLATVLKFILVENRMLPKNLIYKSIDMEEPVPTDETAHQAEPNEEENTHDALIRDLGIFNERVLGLRGSDASSTSDEKEAEDYDFGKKNIAQKLKQPCSVVVLSNMQNPNMQSLIRRYRYDANGALIPSSVKYFIKVPQGLGLAPILVPLNDKAFSPIGGFVRYYKEVPPIPQAW